MTPLPVFESIMVINTESIGFIPVKKLTPRAGFKTIKTLYELRTIGIYIRKETYLLDQTLSAIPANHLQPFAHNALSFLGSNVQIDSLNEAHSSQP